MPSDTELNRLKEDLSVSGSAEPVAEARTLRKVYGETTVVDRISFNIHRGDFCGILGPNGAGKTTTLRMIVGNTKATSGDLSVLGLQIPLHAQKMRARVGIVPQTDNIDPDLSVHENLLVYGRYFGLKKSFLKTRIPHLLDFASLTDRADCRINELSGGMIRRLTIARALISDPELLILDEPTTGLDPQARHTIWQQLRQLQRQGLTLILTTHYMEEAERLCDRIIVMDHGRILADRPPEKLISEEIEAHVLEVEGAKVIEWLEGSDFSTNIRIEKIGETVFIYGQNLSEIVNSLDKQGYFRYSYRPANLEDVFLKMTGRDLRDV